MKVDEAKSNKRRLRYDKQRPLERRRGRDLDRRQTHLSPAAVGTATFFRELRGSRDMGMQRQRKDSEE